MKRHKLIMWSKSIVIGLLAAWFSYGNISTQVTLDTPSPQTGIPAITIDRFSNRSNTQLLDFYNRLDRNIAARVVIDEKASFGESTEKEIARYYAENLKNYVCPYNDSILIGILDSFYMPTYSEAELSRRTNLLLDQIIDQNACPDQYFLFEIGNEVNGNWLDNNSGDQGKRNVVSKIKSVYDTIKYRYPTANTAITLYYDGVIGPNSELEMINWVDNYLIPNAPNVATGVNEVLISYYPEDNEGNTINDYRGLIDKLRTRFPNSKFGIGEIGVPNSNSKSEQVNRLEQVYNPNGSLRYPDLDSTGVGYYWFIMEDLQNNPQVVDGVVDLINQY